MSTDVARPPALDTVSGPVPAPHGTRRGYRWKAKLPTGWPLIAILVLYPLWWVLGMSIFIYPLLAVPMAVHLYRRGNVRVPPGFGIWLALIAFVAISTVMLGQNPADTLPTPGIGKYIAAAIRLSQYLSFTVIMLYVLNFGERELPRITVVKLLGVMCLTVVAGGYVGMIWPHLSFEAPLAHLLPHSIAADPYVQRVMQIDVAQVQDVFSDNIGRPRPSAPFQFTNTWGENLAILATWLVTGWTVLGTGVRRVAGVLVAVVAVVPFLYSLNRGAWIGVGLVIVYVAVRMARRGRFAPIGVIAAGVALIAVLLVASPLGTLVGDRLDNGNSDQIRQTLSIAAVKAAASSPVIGYGGNRALIGSGRSIAIGKSADCQQCGNREIGSNGMLWQLLVSVGFVGALLYNGFFLWVVWRYRRDHSAIGIAASAVLLMMLFFQTAYLAYDSALAYALISVALLVRNDIHRRQEKARVADPRPVPPALDGRSVG